MHYIIRTDLAKIEERFTDVANCTEVARRFLDLFRAPEFSGIAVVLNGPDLRNRRFFEKDFGMTHDMAYLQLMPECFSDFRVRAEIVEACTHHGHLSVFFFPRRPEPLLTVFQYFHHFDYIDGEGDVDVLTELEDISRVEAQHLARFLSENPESGFSVAYAFSHDADFFYEFRF